MIKVDYEKCVVSGDMDAKFPDKASTEAAVRSYLRIVASSIQRKTRKGKIEDNRPFFAKLPKRAK